MNAVIERSINEVTCVMENKEWKVKHNKSIHFHNTIPACTVKGKHSIRIYAECSIGNSYQKLLINLSNFEGKGKYHLGDQGNEITLRFDNRWYSSLRTRVGEVKIDAYDPSQNYIEGYFSFEAIRLSGNRITVKNGYFQIRM